MELNELSIELTKLDSTLVKKYLLRFIPDFERDEKDECCMKNLIRSSGRYCVNCPNHPVRTLSLEDSSYFVAKYEKLVEEGDYLSALEMLQTHDMPIPLLSEAREFVSKNSA